MLKWLYIIIGSIAVFVGVLTFWLPIPTGIPLLMLGVPLLIRFSPRSRKWLIARSRAWPEMFKWVEKFIPSGDPQDD